MDSTRYGIRIKKPLNDKLNEYMESTDIATGKPVKDDLTIQDVLRQAIKEFLERHLK